MMTRARKTEAAFRDLQKVNPDAPWRIEGRRRLRNTDGALMVPLAAVGAGAGAAGMSAPSPAEAQAMAEDAFLADLEARMAAEEEAGRLPHSYLPQSAWRPPESYLSP